MARTLRGDVRWANLNPVRGPEQAGRRPVVILSREVFNERSGTAIAIAVTNRARRAGFPLSLQITSCSLPKRSWVKMSQIRTLAADRIGRKPGRVSPEEMALLMSLSGSDGGYS
ncbi:MAG TPA: type II toxin-antitoxin system PemK/MazF family toxin [Candidatus Hydrogenedentes bacterium]|nr:type II toxin-antitoxin system PemK/MazF family toxin [Candidatus Hydrogenedentota bacterium]